MSRISRRVPIPNDGVITDINLLDQSNLKLDSDPVFIDDARESIKFVQYLEKVCGWANAYLAEENASWRLILPPETRSKIMDSRNRPSFLDNAVRKFSDKRQDGRLHENQVRTVIDVILTGLTDDKHITCGGDKQQGKSAVLIATAHLEPVVRWVVTDERVYPQICITNHKNLEQQIRGDAENFSLWHSVLAVVSVKTRKWCPIETYFDKIVGRKLLDQTCGMWSMTNQIQRQVKSKGRGRRRVPQGVDYINMMIDQMREIGCKPLFLIDESHFGTKKDGVLDSWSRRFIRSLSRLEEGNEAYVRCFSATPYEQLQDEYFTVIQMWLSPGYTGLGCFGGRPSPALPGYVRKLPDLKEFQSYFGLELPLDVNSCYRIKTYLRNIRMLSGNALKLAVDNPKYKREHRAYRAYFVASIAKMIRKLLISDNPKNARGMMLRIGNNNGNAQDLMQEVADSLGADASKIAFIPYMDEFSSELVEDLVRKCNPKQKYCLYATAAARMGCRFPNKDHEASTGYFVDLTWKPSTETAQQQGCWGRAHGYDKDTMVFCNQDVYDHLMDYIQSNGMSTRLPHYRAKLVKKEMRGRKRWNMQIFREDVERFYRKTRHPDYKIMFDTYKIAEHLILMDEGNHGNLDNSRLMRPVMDKLAELVSIHPEVLCDENNESMFKSVKMLRFALTKKDKQVVAAALESHKGVGDPDSIFLTNFRDAKSETGWRRWPYGELVARRSSPATKKELLDWFAGRGRTMQRGKMTNQRGQQRTRAMGDEELIEPQIWICDKNRKGCEKFDTTFGPRPKVVCISLVAREPVGRMILRQVENIIPTDESSFDIEPVDDTELEAG